MDSTCHHQWNSEVEVELPVTGQRRQLGLENELVELLWQNGEVVLHSQTCRKPKQAHKNDPSTSQVIDNSAIFIQDDEGISWTGCPVDETFEKELCSSFLSETPSSYIVGATKLSGHFEGEQFLKFGASDDSYVFRSSQQPYSAPISPLHPRIETFESAPKVQDLGGVKQVKNLDLPVHKPGFNGMEQRDIHELSVMTIGSSHCGSNQIASSCGIGKQTLSAGVDKIYDQKVMLRSHNMDKATTKQAISSSSGGSGNSFWKTSNQSNDINCRKRSRHIEESTCLSDATELESASGNKSSQKSGTTRKNRVAEVHNLSERRRRDRINKKMKALQELIPHSSKSDKASMLDEAIEYMKSLQSQIQLMWMGSGMAQMLHPGMRHCMPQIGMTISPATLPTVHNLMHLSRMPLVDQATAIPPTSNQAAIDLRPLLNPVYFQNQLKNPGFPNHFANYMPLYPMQTTPQTVNMFSYGPHSSQQSHVLTQPGNGNGDGAVA